LAAYRAGQAIVARLAEAEPKDTKWQQDLAESHAKLAMALRGSGDTAAARAELVAARDINARLVKLAPDQTDWRGDLTSVEKALTELGE
jgi:hypothetical protein